MRTENRQLQEKLFEKLDGAYWLDSQRYFACNCIFDVHEKPALMVYSDGAWCASCSKSYSLEYIEKHVSSIPTSYRPVIKEYKTLPRWRKWEKKYGDLEGIAKAAHKNLLATKATYFKNRGLEEWTERAMFGLLDGWAVIPVFDKLHNVIDLVARSIRQKGVKYAVSVLSENEIRPLYCVNWDRLLKSKTVYVTFGIFDIFSFDVLGLASCTGITGKSINKALFDPFPDKEFVIVPDRNEEKDAYSLAEQLGWRGSVLRLGYPFSIKDSDEYRRSMNKSEWEKLYLNEWSK